MATGVTQASGVTAVPGAGGAITSVTNSDGTITVTNGGGPTVTLSGTTPQDVQVFSSSGTWTAVPNYALAKSIRIIVIGAGGGGGGGITTASGTANSGGGGGGGGSYWEVTASPSVFPSPQTVT